MAREISRARRYQQPLSVSILDIDHFKRVNDEFGHPVGDQVLVRTAKLLSSCVRESDTVARWGGEEFAVIAPMTAEDGAARLAEKLRSIMASTHLGPREPVTASFGVAELRPDDTVESLLQRADAALYRAKQSGRNQVCRSTEGSDDSSGESAPKEARATEVANQDNVYANTGFDLMDVEHKALALALNDFVGVVHSGKADEAQAALDDVIRGVADHFAHEEELMAQHGYPLQRRHGEAHSAFLADTRRSLVDLKEAGITSDFRRWAAGRLPEWFRLHILAHDMGLGQFLLGSGAAGVKVEHPAPVEDTVTPGSDTIIS